MKKTLIIIMALVFLLSLTTLGVFAAKGEFAGFTDVDNDGVCDNRESRPQQSAVCTGVGFEDTDDDGICDNRESKPQPSTDCKGEGFEDADNDGVCDNREETPKCRENGTCTGRGYNKNHKGKGNGYGCTKNP